MGYSFKLYSWITQIQHYLSHWHRQWWGLHRSDPLKLVLADQVALLERCWTVENQDQKNRRLLEACWQMHYATGNNSS